MNGFYERLRELMFANDMTIADLAEAIGVPSSTVRTWFSTKARQSAEMACKIARRFSVSVEFLVNGETKAYGPRTVAGALRMLNAVKAVFAASVELAPNNEVVIRFRSPEAASYYQLESSIDKLIENGVPGSVVQRMLDAKLAELQDVPVYGGVRRATQEE